MLGAGCATVDGLLLRASRLTRPSRPTTNASRASDHTPARISGIGEWMVSAYTARCSLHDAELLEEPIDVEDVPVFRKPAVLHAEDVDGIECIGLAGCRDAEPVPGLRA